MACSTLLVVKTPKPMGIRYFEMAFPIPRVTASDTYSKCGVSPRITAPKQISASYFPLAAIRSASKGISNAPGTRMTVISSSSPPRLFNPSNAPSSNFSVMKLLNRLTIIPILIPRASSLPSIIFVMSQRDYRPVTAWRAWIRGWRKYAPAYSVSCEDSEYWCRGPESPAAPVLPP
jgi:hypothetical protein